MITYEICPASPVAFHALAELFPWIEGDALARLKEDIRANGVREPIIFMDGAIIDGRNRYMCARDLGIEYPRREFGSLPSDGADPIAFVLSQNLHRRHLNESQRAMVAQKLANMKQGARTDLTAIAVMSQPEAAKALNVSVDSIQRARKVAETAAPEVVKAVERGEVSVSAAAAVATLPPEEQKAAVAEGPQAVKAKAKAVREKAASPKPDAPQDADRKALAKLTREALEDDVIGLRADLAEVKAKAKEQAAEIASLKAQLRDAQDSDSGQVIRKLTASLKNAENAKWRATEEQGRLQKQIFALKKRVEELEGMGVPL